MAEVGGTSNSLTCLTYPLVFGRTICEVDLEQYPDRPCQDGDRVISGMDCQSIPKDSLKLQEVSRHFIFVYNEIGPTHLQDNFDLEHGSDV